MESTWSMVNGYDFDLGKLHDKALQNPKISYSPYHFVVESCRRLMASWPLIPFLYLCVLRPSLRLFYFYVYNPFFHCFTFLCIGLHFHCFALWDLSSVCCPILTLSRKTMWSPFGFIMALVVGINNLVKVFKLGFSSTQTTRVEVLLGSIHYETKLLCDLA